MLDLETLIEEFIQRRLRSFKEDTAPDGKTVTAVASKDMGRAVRENQVRAWLGYYKVILSFHLTEARQLRTKSSNSQTSRVRHRWTNAMLKLLVSTTGSGTGFSLWLRWRRGRTGRGR